MTPELLKELQTVRQNGKAACLLSRADQGAVMLMHDDAQIVLPDALNTLACAALRSDRLEEATIHGVSWYATPYNPAVTIAIVGAVHIAQAMLPLAQNLGFECKVIDPRGAFAAVPRFSDAQIDHAWPDEALEKMGVTTRTAVVALTHDPKLDDSALQYALASDAFYVGALGSRRTHASRIERLKEHGCTDAQIARIHAPIGLDIGAKSPQEIALAILAQIVERMRKA